MALINEIGNYLKITNVNPFNKMVKFSIFESQSVRENTTEFNRIKEGFQKVEDLENSMLECNKKEKENLTELLITIGYESLKNNPRFANWTDLI